MNRKFFSAVTLLAVLAIGGRGFAAVVTNAVPSKTMPAKVETKAAAKAEVKAEAKPESKNDFQSFHLLTERNIFDMSRSGRVVRGTRTKPAQVDRFTLTGTMSYEHGQFAFFDGTSSGYRQTLKTNDTIANYKIVMIQNDYIKLADTNKKVFNMPVGLEMSRRDGGPWSMGMAAESSIASSEVPDNGRSSESGRGEGRRGGEYGRERNRGANQMSDRSTSTVAPTASDTSGGGSNDDVVKRLMEKRLKEENSDK